MKWVKINLEEDLIQFELFRKGIPFLGYSKKWVNEDFNPKGIRECYSNDLVQIASAKWNATHDEWSREDFSKPTHICLYEIPKK